MRGDIPTLFAVGQEGANEEDGDESCAKYGGSGAKSRSKESLAQINEIFCNEKDIV